jgi:hypothetical protein
MSAGSALRERELRTCPVDANLASMTILDCRVYVIDPSGVLLVFVGR